METVEQFIARGGKINTIPFGVSGEKIQMKRSKKKGATSTHVKQVKGQKTEFNPSMQS